MHSLHEVSPLMIHRFFLILLLWNLVASAQENPLRVELIAQTTSIQPGEPFLVGLHLQHPPGYHSYWKFPGVVGIATSLEWDLPKGWKAEEIQWPAPERVLMFQIKAQGYHGEKLLRIKLTPSADLTPGQHVELNGKARWMCCGRNCNPGLRELTLKLPVSASTPSPDERWSALFSKSAAAMVADSKEWSGQAERKGAELVIQLTPVSKAAKAQLARIKKVTFFTDNGLIDPNRPELLRRMADKLVLTQTLSEFAPDPLPERVTGILQSAEGWLPGGEPTSIAFSEPLSGGRDGGDQ